MDDKLLEKKILKRAKDLALKEYLDRAVDYDSPDLFLAKCYAHGYIGALSANGYKITIEKGEEKYVFPKR